MSSKKVEVVALERGHCGEKVREAGDVFEVDAKRLEDGSTWFAPVNSDEAGEAPKPKKPEPATGAGRGNKPAKPE